MIGNLKERTSIRISSRIECHEDPQRGLRRILSMSFYANSVKASYRAEPKTLSSRDSITVARRCRPRTKHRPRSDLA
jgi:hypothetical protein